MGEFYRLTASTARSPGRRFTGLRLVAMDTDLTLGDAPDFVELPAVDLLLRVTGRV